MFKVYKEIIITHDRSMPSSEAVTRAKAKYDQTHKDEISQKRREYHKAYDDTRPKISWDEEAKQTYNEYHRQYYMRHKLLALGLVASEA